MGVQCKICQRAFYSSQTLKRHMSTVHEVLSHDGSDSDSDSDSAEDLVPSDEALNESDNGSDKSSSSDDDEHEGMEEDKSFEASNDDEPSIWIEIIETVLKDGKEVFQNDDGTIKTSKLIKKIRDITEWHLSTADAIRDTDVFKQINKTEKQFMKQGYEDDEALNAAWNMREFLVRKEIINPNSHMFEESDDGEDDIGGM